MSDATYTILAVNPGSTSTKIAVYEDAKELFRGSVDHDAEILNSFSRAIEQIPLREQGIMDCLKQHNFDLSRLSAVAGRGGPLPPVKQGAYIINDVMLDYLANKAQSEHPSKLGAIISHRIASRYDIPAYIYDSIRVDEVGEVAKLSGLPVLPRKPGTHMLNMRAVSIKTAKQMGKKASECTFIVAHLGGGITLSVLSQGQMLDYVGDDEGPFSPDRAGRLPYRRLIDLCYSGKYSHVEMMKAVRGKGGLVGYLGTNQALEVEKMIDAGDKTAEGVYYGMACQIAKSIGELATVVKGRVDAIILTGGIAHSRRVTSWVEERVSFIAPVKIVPGENELEALALGVLRVLKGEEDFHHFVAAL
ncbi:MAG: butyrate kinase [Desulfovibrio sp.]|jgi:butyrate kinase|nr:butyrate kinase [Desulfovibrio sp.]